MNRYVALGCLGLGLMVSPLLGAIGNTAVPANPKIGVINIEETLSSTPAGKRASEAFEKTRKTKQGLLDKQQEELKKADADLVKQKAVLKPEVFDAKRQELEKKFVDLQQTYVKLERELAQDRIKLISDLQAQAQPKIEAIAKAEGISVVLDTSATHFFDPAVDLTKKLNAEMK
ncbi:MAG TPA: OmpH family outer membrane protein [Kofleriaceae bacterium]